MAEWKRRRSENGRHEHQNIDFYFWSLTFLAIMFGLIHRWHVSTLFENDRHFSHLTEIEREMSFRTEMGMYYSYYKTIIESKDFFTGINKIRHDNLSEYGNVIDATRRYNILPEILAAFFYHLGKWMDLLPEKQCWKVCKENYSDCAVSCDGLKVPIYFYLEFVWGNALVTVMMLFYYASYLSNSLFGGLLAVSFFFFNHNECTRVQWAPSLRETFGYPLLLSQMWSVSMIIRNYTRYKPASEPISVKQTSKRSSFMNLCYTTFASLSVWQFSHFVLMTQVIALLILKFLKIIPNNLYNHFCIIHAIAILIASVLTNGTLIIYSIYGCLIISSIIVMSLKKLFQSLNSSSMIQIILEISVIIILTMWMRFSIFYTEDTAHVFNLFKAKLTNYSDFHTMLYTCAPEFDFLSYTSYIAIVKSLLLPTAILAGIFTLYYWCKNFKTSGYPCCIEAEMAYNGLQLGAFIIMAVFIMRLKLFMMPHLCLMASTVCSRRYLLKFGLKNEFIRTAAIVLLLSGMLFYGIPKIQEEHSHIGEYSNVPQEKLFEWIKLNTPKNAVFAGRMSLMANVMLSTNRPIVNNPYYESKEMRDRTMKVYRIFSREDIFPVYISLKNMKVDYVILDELMCFGFANVPQGCQMVDLWDMVDKGRAKAENRSRLCPILYKKNPYPFIRVFSNADYVVLQLKYPVSINVVPISSM